MREQIVRSVPRPILLLNLQGTEAGGENSSFIVENVGDEPAFDVQVNDIANPATRADIVKFAILRVLKASASVPVKHLGQWEVSESISTGMIEGVILRRFLERLWANKMKPAKIPERNPEGVEVKLVGVTVTYLNIHGEKFTKHFTIISDYEALFRCIPTVSLVAGDKWRNSIRSSV